MSANGYELHGPLLEACSCGVLCPCWIGEDPDQGTCDAFNAYHFDRGTIGDVDVSGLTFVRVVQIPGNVLAPGSWRQVVFIDDRATGVQRQAILDAYDGKLGGPLADLAALIGETVAVQGAPIKHEVSDGKGGRRCRGSHDAPLQGAGRHSHNVARLALLYGAGHACVCRRGRLARG